MMFLYGDKNDLFHSIQLMKKNLVMKTNKKSSIMLSFLTASFLLFSFSNGKGGDSFQIYLNGKVLIDQAVYMDKSVKSLQINSTSSNDKLDIYYSHCGRTGTDRSITVKDEKNNAVKTWKFADTKERSAMTMMMKDIHAALKNKESKFSLVYSSKELPSGKSLAVLNLSNRSFARK
jgi:hypothetical protein